MKVVTDKVGGMKYTLALVLTFVFLAFGVYCVEKKVNLIEASAFIASVTTQAGVYYWANVRQKNGGSKTK